MRQFRAPKPMSAPIIAGHTTLAAIPLIPTAKNPLRNSTDDLPLSMIPWNRVTARSVVAHDNRDISFERLSLLYQENARVAAAFWEWQHKTLTIFTAGITALLAIEVWIYNNDLGRYMAVPPGTAAVLSWLCMRFADRNRAILNTTYAIGKELESKITAGLQQPDEPIFTWLGSQPGTYRRALPRMFRIAVVVFLGLAIAAVIHAPQNTGHPASTGTDSVSATCQWHSSYIISTCVVMRRHWE